MKFFKLILFLYLVTGTVRAQNKYIFISSENIPNGIEINLNKGKYLIRFYNKNIVETSFVPLGETFNKSSHAVVLKPEKGVIKENINKNETIKIGTNGIKVVIRKAPFQISYFYKDHLLLSQNKAYTKTDSTEIISFKISSDEVLYGGGERILGMNRRGYRLQLYNRAHYGYETHSELMNFTIPVVISSKNYLIHFDNPEIGFLDLDSAKNNTLAYETIGGRKTFQIIASDEPKQLTEMYTALTGRQPMPPRWALGNFSSRFGYHSQKEVLKTVALFKKYKIPLDAVVIDIYWFGPEIKGSMGNLEFFKDSFPHPEEMIKTLKKEGIKTVLVTEPFILTTSKRWQEASENGYLGKDKNGKSYRYDFYFGNTGIIDIFNPDAKTWFWNIYKDLTETGVSGWWGDLGEPEVHPSDLIHTTGTADEVHNIYGHNWAKMIYKGYRKDFPEQRPFILMRAGYSGSQHYGMIPWSGDVNRSWGGLQAQPEIILQMGMQGMAYMHSDLGGFAGGEIFDPELYIRWLQYGVFQPVFRPHAQEHIAPEPVFHDEKTRDLAQKAIELRYKLLPYNYTLAFQNHLTGIPFTRPLFYEEPGNKNLLTYSKTFLWGDDLLVSPVVEKGIQTQKVYFPKTASWYDFFNGNKFKGGTTQEVVLKEDHIPVFVRGGAFIPMIDIIENTDNYSIKNLKIHYFYDRDTKKSTSCLYHDDGKTPEAFKKGKYEILNLSGKLKNNKLILKISTQSGKAYHHTNKNIEIIIHNLDKKPSRVSEKNYRWDDKKKELYINFEYTRKTKKISVKL